MNESGSRSVPKSGYEVGWGKPPRQYCYKKGQSGNPAGAPKRKGNNLLALLTDVLDKGTTVRVNGKVRNASNYEAMLLALVQNALRGQLAAVRRLIKLAKKVGRWEDTKRRIGGVLVLPLDPNSQEAKVRQEYAEAMAAGEDPFEKYGLPGSLTVGGKG